MLMKIHMNESDKKIFLNKEMKWFCEENWLEFSFERYNDEKKNENRSVKIAHGRIAENMRAEIISQNKINAK